ncbi:MAG: phosphatidylserine decarboxylase [Burkholderiales bacterium]|nr:phosphatidylserine decarboxylase [Burkholderiales bacterium]
MKPRRFPSFRNPFRHLPLAGRLLSPLRRLARPRRLPNPLRRIAAIESLNFLVTNRIPRVALTRGMGWYSAIRSPTLTRASLAVWRLFSEVDLSDAEPRRYRSLQEVFTRRLVPGARIVDPHPEVLASPSDAIVGACGRVVDGLLLQAKGSAYRLEDLLRSREAAQEFANGVYVTLRLTSAMYHRFHAPHDLTVDRVTYVSGDAYNVNPPALARLPGLFCRNERAVLRATLERGGHRIALVPVAAILVASIRLHCIDVLLRLRHRGPDAWECNARHGKGEEMGWFEHGSTIIVFAPAGFTLAPGIAPGRRLRMGQALMQWPA